MVFKVIPKGFVAFVEGRGLFPVYVGFGETSNVNLVSCDVTSKEVEFSVVSAGVEAVGIL